MLILFLLTSFHVAGLDAAFYLYPLLDMDSFNGLPSDQYLALLENKLRRLRGAPNKQCGRDLVKCVSAMKSLVTHDMLTHPYMDPESPFLPTISQETEPLVKSDVLDMEYSRSQPTSDVSQKTVL
uniref:Uncharacterized protein n=1 Tax=Schistocephalus solidus TaxID=70667 RepID=A0A0X3PUK6_SCHSO